MRTYLGDGVYAEFVDGMIKLTKEDQAKISTIYLYPKGYSALVKWVEALK